MTCFKLSDIESIGITFKLYTIIDYDLDQPIPDVIFVVMSRSKTKIDYCFIRFTHR